MKILVSAIEHSANIHLKALSSYLPDAKFIGIFDKSLGEPIEDLRSLAIMGISDAIKRVPFFLKLAKEMVELSKEADIVLLIDGSGFNLPLAKRIKKAYPSKKIIYYILPQAWAWRRYRIKELEQNIDFLASILPFEANYYSKDANIEFVGHPLLDEIKEFKDRAVNKTKRVAFLPGSRRAEIKSLMPLFRGVRERLKDIEAILVIPPYFKESEIEALYGDISSFKIEKDTHKTLYRSDFAFICSGTATLESALIGTPFVLAYKAKALDYFIATKVVKIQVEYAGLANLFSLDFQKRPMHPELIQDNLTIDNLIREFELFNRERYFSDVLKLRSYLRGGSSKRVANIINLLHR